MVLKLWWADRLASSVWCARTHYHYRICSLQMDSSQILAIGTGRAGGACCQANSSGCSCLKCLAVRFSSICPFVRKLGLCWCAFEPNVKVQGVISRCGICNGGIADPSTHAGDAASTNAIAIWDDGGRACVCECKTVSWHSAASAVTGKGWVWEQADKV